MKKKSASTPRLPVILFSLIMLVVFASALCRMYRIAPLYTQSDVRARVQWIVEEFAQNKGVLLSSIQIKSISSTELHLELRDYHRGRDVRETHVIPLTSQK